MARTFISQPNQVYTSEAFNDALTLGVSLQTSSLNLQTDLNAIRTQIRQLLWANVSGSWYDTITAPSGSLSARGVNTINVDLTDLEQKRFLTRKANNNLVNVATGSNFALLSASLGTAPDNYAVVFHPLLAASALTGSIVALLSGTEGTYNSHSVALVSGSSNNSPKNLVIVKDAWTGFMITASLGRNVFGLLQVENGAASGDSFNDSNRRTQISFVNRVMTNATSSWVATPAQYIGGKTIKYGYTTRVALDEIPEDACFGDSVFFDNAQATTSSYTTITDVSSTISASLSESKRVRKNAGVTTVAGIAADTDVTYPTNIDAQLPSYYGRDFKNDVEVYLNGILLLPGDSTNKNDVYPGTSAATGDLKFPFLLRSGTQLSVKVY